MPTYDYACKACGHEFEKYHSITADAIRTCPECGMKKVQRLIGGGAGILFKGSGFYQTDYRSENYQSAAKKDKDVKAQTSKTDKKTSAKKGKKDSS